MKRKIDAKQALSLAVDLALYDKSEEIQILRRNAKKVKYSPIGLHQDRRRSGSGNQYPITNSSDTKVVP